MFPAELERAHAPEISRRKKIDRHGIAVVAAESAVDLPPAKSQVDVPDEKVDVAAAAPDVVDVYPLIADGQADLLRERRRHDHQ